MLDHHLSMLDDGYEPGSESEYWSPLKIRGGGAGIAFGSRSWPKAVAGRTHREADNSSSDMLAESSTTNLLEGTPKRNKVRQFAQKCGGSLASGAKLCGKGLKIAFKAWPVRVFNVHKWAI